MKIFHYNKSLTHKQTVRSISFRNSSHFMKPRSFVLKRGSPPSLSWIRSVHAPNYLLEGSVLKLPSHLHLGILSVVFPSSTPTEPLTSPYVPHSTLISFYLILSPENCLARGANRKEHYEILFIHLLLTLSRYKIFSQHCIFEYYRPMLFAQCERQCITPIQNRR